ncbi:MAG TPA: ABC transporter ATP-binding protein [Chthoniobacterales bacterium]
MTANESPKATDTAKKSFGALRNLGGVLLYLRKYSVGTAGAIGMLLVIMGIELSLPQVVGRAITALKDHLENATPFVPLAFAGVFLGLSLSRETLRFGLGRLRSRVIQGVLADIRGDIYDAIQWLPFSFHDKNNTGELISRSTSDIQRLQEFLFACLFLSVDIFVFLIGSIVLIWLTNWQLGVAACCVLAPAIGLLAFYSRKLHPLWRQVHDRYSEMTTVIQENIAGVRVVKAFASEEREIEKFRARNAVFIDAVTRTINFWAARVPMAQFFFGLGVPVILWLGGRQVISGELLVGDLAKVVFYLLAIGNRMQSVGIFANVMQNASASAGRILEIIHEPPAIVSGTRDLPIGRGAVSFENVCFRYRDGRASLENFSLQVAPGETVALVGATGAGKTTVVNLIPRFYDATDGIVRVEGVNVRELRLDQLRRTVAVIFQETFLFSATVAENIAFGRPDATREQIMAAAQAAQAAEFIEKLEDGYDTMVGERGMSLSGGQKQRIAIARAFLMDPRILILDDATAAVDPETERLIREAMVRLTANRTTFLIAHRFSTVRHAQRIVVLEKGRVVETGTHAELLAKDGAYCHLFAAQLGGLEGEPAESISPG